VQGWTQVQGWTAEQGWTAAKDSTEHSGLAVG
jgi:hypothetical protein